MFDFNGDGRVDTAEELASLMILDECRKSDGENRYTPSYRPKWTWSDIVCAILCVWSILDLIAELM